VDPNGDALTLTVTGLPTWMTWDPNSRIFTGTPDVFGQYAITVTATDGWGASTNLTFNVIAGI
jgi:hypothetical protein